MSRHYSAALPVAYVVLRLLIVLNWLYGAVIFGLVVALFVDEAWTLQALGIASGSWLHLLLPGLRAIAMLGLVAVPLNHVVLTRLLAMVWTVRRGDPFVAANASRLHAIAWALLALQLLAILIGGIAKAISTPEHPIHLDAGFSVAGWLAVLLTFVLARVFAEGAAMREELEGTV